VPFILSCVVVVQNTERLSVRGSRYYADPACVPDGFLSGAGCDEQSNCRVPVVSTATSGAGGGCVVPGERN